MGGRKEDMKTHLVPLSFLALTLTLAAPAFARGRRDVEGVVNLNNATAEQLHLLPGVGPAKVRNIVAYRQAHPFRTAEELVRIKGIGPKMVRLLRVHLVVTGATTAKSVVRTDPAPASPPAHATQSPAAAAKKTRT
jgi:competence protein ComEA